MTKLKVCIPITTRGNYAKMKRIIELMLVRDDFDVQIIAAGGTLLPRYGNIIHTLQEKFPVVRRIPYLVEGENLIAMAKSAGLASLEFATAFEDLAPDVTFVIADRYECLPIAMAASYLNVPVAHIEGGELTGSIDENIRHAITKLAKLHFPATQEAAERIIRMGEAPQSVFPVGATSLDVIKDCNLTDLDPLFAFQEIAGAGAKLDYTKPYIIVIQHPVTTEYSHNRSHLMETQSALHDLGMGIVWLWPNMDAGADMVAGAIRGYRENVQDNHTRYYKGLNIEHFSPLLANARCIVGNSSTGIREAAFLGVPCVNIGSRQQNRSRSRNVIDVPHDADKIRAALDFQLQHRHYPSDTLYGDGNAAQKIVDTLAGYTFPAQKTNTY